MISTVSSKLIKKKKLRKINLLEIQALEDPTIMTNFIDDDDIDVYGDDDFDDIPTVSELLPNKNNLIKGQEYSYSVGRKLSPGRYGAVYEVLRKNDGKQFVAKLEVIDTGFNGLNNDYKILKLANKMKCQRLTQIIDRGKIEGHFKFIVMKMENENLWKLRHQFIEHRFSAPTSLRLAMETLNAIEELHSLGYVHRDIKPSNFLLQKSTNQIIIIDFGICRSFKTLDGDIRSPRDTCLFRGTTRYASLTTHNEQEQSSRDDLESWLYMVVEMMTGSLPWSQYRKPDRDITKRLKEASRTLEGSYKLFKYCPRIEFRRIMNYLDGLSYYSQPDYNFIKSMIKLSMKNNDIKPDEPYDWEVDEEEDDCSKKDDESINGTVDGSVDESVDGTIDGSVDESVDGNNEKNNNIEIYDKSNYKNKNIIDSLNNILKI